MKHILSALLIAFGGILVAADGASPNPKQPHADVQVQIKTPPKPKAQAAPEAKSSVATPSAKKDPAPTPPVAAPAVYDRTRYFGEPVFDKAGKLLYVEENKSQIHSKENYVWVKVSNIKKDDKARAAGRIRVAVWNSAANYGKEGVAPYRACSHWAKAVLGDEMTFKIGGLTVGEKLAFFAHFDEENTGKVRRNFLGIPNEQFIFSNGLERQGFSAPKFEKTLVTYEKPGQVIELKFR